MVVTGVILPCAEGPVRPSADVCLTKVLDPLPAKDPALGDQRMSRFVIIRSRVGGRGSS